MHAGGCLLAASSLDHVIAWHWCTTESTGAYSALLDGITAPLIVVTNSGRAAANAINNCWPTTAVQRCLIHAQRTVRRHTTSRPRTNGGRAIYQLALNLTKITSFDHAAQWGVQLHQYECVYRNWLNEKTWTTDLTTKQRTWPWTHEGARRAYNSLNNLWRRNLLFTYHNPPGTTLDPQHLKSTTNSLEGGINAQLKLLARTHRGTHAEHQRRMLEWRLYLKNGPAQRPSTNRQAAQQGSRPTRQSPNPDPQREPSRPRNRTTSPLRQSYRHHLQPLTRHPKRPTPIPTHQQKHALCRLTPFCRLTGSSPIFVAATQKALIVNHNERPVVELVGLEPTTPCLQSRCATSCAIAPLLSSYRT